jgi:hypothetical protein
MTHKSLLAAAAAVSIVSLSSGTQAGGCPLSDRAEARPATVITETDRMLRRVGDRLTRAGDRLFDWGHGRPRS